MSPDRPNIELPGIECNLATEYTLGHSWMRDIKGLHPVFQQTSQSLRNLFTNGKEWSLETFGISLSPSIHEDAGLVFVFYSSARERNHYTKKDLVLNLDDILQPRVLSLRKSFTKNLRHQTNWITFPAIDIPPLSLNAKPNNPIDPYIISRMVIRDFNIYLDHELSPGGGGIFSKPVFDPRRLVAEVGVVNPVSSLIERVKQQDKQYQEERKHLLEEQTKLPQDAWKEAMKNLDMAERANRKVFQKLTQRNVTTLISL